MSTVTRSNQTRAPKGASGTCRDRRRPQGGGRPAWVRPFRRACRALDASLRLICSTLPTVAASKRCAHRRPIRASRNLDQASARLVDASARLQRAARALAKTNECAAREPERAGDVPALVVQTTENWLYVSRWLAQVADDVFAFHEDVLLGLETGQLVPERPADRRPRIVLAPRPVPIRAFLLLRQPRVADRIACILRRRRRIPRPASIRVPRRTLLGRAPPLF